MAEELKDFIDDWKISIREKSAVHKSGLKISYDSMNKDGTMRVAYSGMSSFLRNTFAETKSPAVVEERREKLTREFIEIFKQKMSPSFDNAAVKTAQREY